MSGRRAPRSGRLVRGILRGVACALALVASSAAPAQVVVQDDLKREVRLVRAPARVISLAPSVTETICALGECARLVATDRWSDHPPEVRTLPKAGGLDDTSLETVVRLRPDVVFAYRSAPAIDRLAGLGIAVVAVDADRLADIARVTTLVATVLGVPERATALNARLAAELDTIARESRARRADRAKAPSIYFEIDSAFHAASRGSFIGELLDRLDTRNIVPAALGAFPRVNGELVVRADPDVLILSAADAPRVATRPGWSTLRAVRETRICTFAPPERDAIVRPGPRVTTGLRALADCLERVAP
jgi:iron complex transport system substrate-binding protein